ncbi:hypothetical protein ALP83_100129 [Pseudomonas syringae pv. actinidiae]|uniref:Uncharacterized protein n=1 Tax=Pseudomonas syringae pv. actinidiae TaxID=103796 RepID=A0A7Z6UE91_PSESF|nr:hypothetical protein ALP83_100129 [Pseudomonas syringae pv. actinidiae]
MSKFYRQSFSGNNRGRYAVAGGAALPSGHALQVTAHKVVCRTGDFVSQGYSLAPRAVPRRFRLAGLFSFARKGMFAH